MALRLSLKRASQRAKQKKDGIFISHDKYVDEILKKFGFIEVKAANTPIETQKLLLKDVNGEEVDVHMYRSMIGSLMYLTSSRPDIMFAVCACARYQVNPKVSHLHAVKRIFSDYAGASLDRKSTIGGCQFLRCRLISWQCKKQTVVANSITEAEYVAASSCCGQVLWIQNQLLDYGYNFMHTKIFIDNNRKANKSVRLMMEKLFGMELELILSTGVVKTINGEVQLHALVDGKKIIISEASVRRDLKLEDEEDEAFYKELGDSLVRAATTASSLEVEQDSGLLNLEKTKPTQHNMKIASLKKRVKKLEQKKRSRTHGLKRLHKVGISRRVESSGDEEDLGEDASKQERRINAIDADDEITLASKITLGSKHISTLEKSKTQVKGVVIEEPSVPVSAINASIKAKVQDKRKGIMVEPEPVKPTKKKV
ncbi:hypothetical protein Tco_0356932 [Tanacetum coccineum]